MKKNILLFSLLSLFMFSSCKTQPQDFSLIPCPSSIKKEVVKYVKLYENEETEYDWGGQDPLPFRTLKIDCSGLVIRCYEYALTNTNLSLPFTDTTAKEMENKYSFKTATPEAGDLIFMGEEESCDISHIAIYLKTDENGNVHFIDATQKGEINGVSERSYSSSDKKIKSYGIMAVVQQ